MSLWAYTADILANPNHNQRIPAILYPISPIFNSFQYSYIIRPITPTSPIPHRNQWGVGNLWNCGLQNVESNLWNWNCTRLLIGQVSTPRDVAFSANYQTVHLPDNKAVFWKPFINMQQVYRSNPKSWTLDNKHIAANHWSLAFTRVPYISPGHPKCVIKATPVITLLQSRFHITMLRV